MPDGGGTQLVENHPLAPLDVDRFRVAVTLVTAVALASESMPGSGNGSTLVMSASAAITQYRALFGADRFSVQAGAGGRDSQRVGVLTDRVAPSWPTRSISTRPGAASSHCAQVRIAMASLSSEPGLVWLRPRNVIAARSGARRRSIVAGDIAVKASASSSLTSISPKRRNVATRPSPARAAYP